MTETTETQAVDVPDNSRVELRNFMDRYRLPLPLRAKIEAYADADAGNLPYWPETLTECVPTLGQFVQGYRPRRVAPKLEDVLLHPVVLSSPDMWELLDEWLDSDGRCVSNGSESVIRSQLTGIEDVFVLMRASVQCASSTEYAPVVSVVKFFGYTFKVEVLPSVVVIEVSFGNRGGYRTEAQLMFVSLLLLRAFSYGIPLRVLERDGTCLTEYSARRFGSQPTPILTEADLLDRKHPASFCVEKKHPAVRLRVSYPELAEQTGETELTIALLPGGASLWYAVAAVDYGGFAAFSTSDAWKTNSVVFASVNLRAARNSLLVMAQNAARRKAADEYDATLYALRNPSPPLQTE